VLPANPRIGILVIDPDLEAEPLPDLDGIGAEREPLVREIGRDEARTRMNESPADAAGFEVLELALDSVLGHQVVPDPERGAPVCGRRIGEGLKDRRVRRALGRPGAGRARGGDGQDEDEGSESRGSTLHGHDVCLSLSVGNSGAGRRMSRSKNIRPQI
jgi:hypothetical protein